MKRATSEMSEQGRYFAILTWIGRGRQPTASTTQGVMYVKGFRSFISRGNLIELAVAVVIGTAFTAVVTAIVADLITPLIGAIAGQQDEFTNLTFKLNNQPFKYGALLNALLSFLIIAAVVYYLIVAPMARITARFQRQAEVTTRDCPECLSTIPIAATRCMYCTVPVAPVPASPPVRPQSGPWLGRGHFPGSAGGPTQSGRQ
jgi:large conductance mechanosensitive channel